MAALAHKNTYKHVKVWEIKEGAAHPFTAIKASPYIKQQKNLYLSGIAFQLSSSNHAPETSHYLRTVNWTSSDGTERSRKEFSLNLPPGAQHEIEAGIRAQEAHFLQAASKPAMAMQLWSKDVDVQSCFKSCVDTYHRDRAREGKVPDYGPSIKVTVPTTCKVELLDDTNGSKYSYTEVTHNDINKYKTAIVMASMMFGARSGKEASCFSRLTAMRITLVKSSRKEDRKPLAGKRKREQMIVPHPIM